MMKVYGYKMMLATMAIFLLACNKGRYFESHLEKVLGKPTFRDMQIGETYSSVLKKEEEKYMQFPDSNIIQYMYHVSDTEEYQWAYIFDDEKLQEIQFDVYLGSTEDGKICTRKIKEHYDKEWGSSSEKDGIISWKKDNTSADLVNESDAVGMGKVKLFIYLTPEVPVKRTIPGID